MYLFKVTLRAREKVAGTQQVPIAESWCNQRVLASP